MYFRKCWRDNRLSFLIQMGLMVAGAASAGLVPALVYSNETGWSLIRGGDAQWVARTWAQGLGMLLGSGMVLGMAAGLVLGASGVGDEFRTGGCEYLLTRSRSRRYFLWTGWCAGMAQLAVICLVSLLTGVILLAWVTGQVLTWEFLAAFPMALVSCAVTFGISYFLTILCRDSRLGLNLSFALVGAYILAAVCLQFYYQIKLPSVWNMLLEFPGHGRLQWAPFPVVRVILWWVLALALPAAAQPVLERSDA
jgi:ABC-type transport system involved in multi-copper enzyme maturation permease subunit